MSTTRNVFLVLVSVLLSAGPAAANQGPGPHVILSEVLILPVMILLSLAGGAYAILAILRPKRRKVIRVLGAIFALLVSALHEGLGLLVALIFGYFAVKRGLQMIGWGLRVRSGEAPPEHLVKANPRQLIPAGVLLVVVTLFLMGMAAAFFDYWPSAPRGVERGLRTFVAYQLAYGNLEKTRTGSIRFHRLGADDELSREFARYFFWGPASPGPQALQVEYGPEERRFTVFVQPFSGFPFFPYNYLTSQLSYRGDETGQIRMASVHHRDARCPADAPVVIRVNDQALRKMLQDPEEDGLVQLVAALALGRLNDPLAIEPLIAALKIENTSMREKVADALKRITGQDFGQNVEDWEKWWREHRGIARVPR